MAVSLSLSSVAVVSVAIAIAVAIAVQLEKAIVFLEVGNIGEDNDNGNIIDDEEGIA